MGNLYAGTGQAFSFLGINMRGMSWTFTIVNPTEPSTAFGSGNYADEASVGGIQAVYTVTGLMDDGAATFPAGWLANPTASLSATIGTYTLTLAAGKTITGLGVLRGISPAKGEVTLGAVTVTFASRLVITANF